MRRDGVGELPPEREESHTPRSRHNGAAVCWNRSFRVGRSGVHRPKRMCAEGAAQRAGGAAQLSGSWACRKVSRW
jgi:hypothetical protein